MSDHDFPNTSFDIHRRLGALEEHDREATAHFSENARAIRDIESRIASAGKRMDKLEVELDAHRDKYEKTVDRLDDAFETRRAVFRKVISGVFTHLAVGFSTLLVIPAVSGSKTSNPLKG
ncbi:MAG: hypothetical protein BECKG1743D_GA0114223_103185 [Candidatus Kentron sp. G]|nr:MAG: hypothetical protein BECKG1743D_GA0114223_103185 [Candidatus Kentron sp. G]